ncbi:MAG: hypothetical protein K0R18_501 [Bacillales bacterium]|jgi:antitoxin component of RelBE/YafQ-DinJ toxin-antitoxin module|nr:hypothetical protein [Bacillales bacterium]
MSKYDVVLNIKLDQELKSAIEKFAEEYDVTSSSVVRSILKQHFNKVDNLNEKQTYYYDHLLQEIINNQDQINDVEFQSSFGKNPLVKVVKVGKQEEKKNQMLISRIEALENSFTKYVPATYSLAKDRHEGIVAGDLEIASEIIKRERKKGVE